MSIGSFARNAAPGPMSEINTTPLVDVMLVLLVILLVTAPLLDQAVKIELPRATASPVDSRPETVRITLGADGQLFWNGERTDAVSLAIRLGDAAAHSPPPELHLAADRSTAYEHVARTLGAVRKAGLARLRFVTRPGEGHAASH
ncbi:MAG: biopolymer transporter ExbD [Dokdonella sp.]|nr:MAG: biopolymer transporter ExbD [Dokdonella sp.]